MILDSSAVAAVCLGESSAEEMISAMDTSEALRMSAATYVEVAAVLDSRRPGALDIFMHGLAVEVVPVDPRQAELARTAYQAFGKGSGHPARLNFGDCFSYALSIDFDEPLLFTGLDFGHTDVIPAR